MPAGVRDVRAMIGRLGALQIDSVNVLVRSHYLPAFSRYGPYDRGELDRAVYGKPRRIFEYWGHEASYLPLALFPAMRWRMARARCGEGVWANVARVGREERTLIARVREAIASNGPSGASDFDEGKRSEKWWGWTDTKRAVEFLFWCGEITPVGRRSSFERIYDLTERVIPAQFRDRALEEPAAVRALVEHAARALGVATESDLRDYFRLPLAQTRTAVGELVDAGMLVPAGVEHWPQAAYLHRDTRVPRAFEATALLSPFDSLVWKRDRTHRLFDFHYRIEIYTPAHKRIHGYYVLPFLLDGELVARVDLKADRERSRLLVQGVHIEPAVARRTVQEPLHDELSHMARWLALERVVYARSRPIA